MKFLLRVCGTWFLGLALVLIIIDGAKSLASSTVVTTSFAEMWSSLSAASWTAFSTSLTEMLAQVSAEVVAQVLFNLPAWVVFGVAGSIMLLLGRQRIKARYIAAY